MLYDSIRRHEHAKFDTGLIQDIFHANGEVLDVIKHWHEYLRIAARRGDGFTGAVLDMVDNHMLVTPDKRWEARAVSEHFGTLLRSLRVDSEEVPDVLEKILRELDLRADQEFKKSVNRLDSNVAKRLFLQEEQTETGTTTRPRYKSEAKPSNTRIRPTAQRSVHRKDLLEGHNQCPEVLPIVVVSPSPSSQDFHATVSGPAAVVPAPDSHSLTREVFTIFRMKEQLEALGRDRNPVSIKSFRERRKSVKGGFNHDMLLSHYKDRDIVGFLSIGSLDFCSANLLPKIFLVDNGSTMKSHWYEATFLLEVLIWRVLGYDSAGIQLLFTNPETEPSAGPNKKQTVESFLQRMRAAFPRSATVKTKLRPSLSKIMNGYYENWGKPRTVLILTDGLWEGMAYEEDVEEWVKQAVCELADLNPNTLQLSTRDSTEKVWQNKFQESRPITFHFISFGHSRQGKNRLKRLDNLLNDNGLP